MATVDAESILNEKKSFGAKVSDVRKKMKELRMPWFPITVLVILVICALFAPFVSPHDPSDLDVLKGVQKIGPFESAENVLGVDRLGRDMLSRLIYGARISAFISLVSLAFGAIVGTAIGIASGYFGGKTDAFIMRCCDAVMGFPTILLALIIVAIQGGAGIQNVIIAIMATVWARFARQIRGEVLTLKERDFVVMAVVAGVRPHVIMYRHIFPNVVNTVLIIVSLLVGQTILLEASLSFLGVGVPPGTSAWGIMVSEGRDNLVDLWWLSLLPGACITIVVICMNLFGDWLRDTLDPKLRRT
ncbi:MAG: peptide ABC transporter permease [Dehalococcoidia bacterium]|nr:peptide ABC transporter permease [Dehalococcoidia bacterium]|tara:strand:+ start:21628 stop:22533 length:906 start_codon:yes stop_codon:yes gene_type:complete